MIENRVVGGRGHLWRLPPLAHRRIDLKGNPIAGILLGVVMGAALWLSLGALAGFLVR